MMNKKMSFLLAMGMVAEELYDNYKMDKSILFNSGIANDYSKSYYPVRKLSRYDSKALANLPNRNEPCPCGSGKKFKKCCMNKFMSLYVSVYNFEFRVRRIKV